MRWEYGNRTSKIATINLSGIAPGSGAMRSGGSQGVEADVVSAAASVSRFGDVLADAIGSRAADCFLR